MALAEAETVGVVAGDLPVPSASLWKNRDFILLLSGQGVSSIGTFATQLAFPLLILSVTNSPALAGLLGALRSVPYAFLILPVGAFIDRWDRRRAMILSDTGRAIALGSIPLALALGHLSLVQVYIVALVEGTLFTVFNVAEAACLSRVLPKEQIPTGVARGQIVDASATLVGPSLGGALYGINMALPFLTDAVSYCASAFSLLFMKTKFQKDRTVKPVNLRADIQEGLSWLWKQRIMRFIAIQTGVLNLCGSGYILILIVLAQHMHVSSLEVGLVVGSGSLGSVLAALAVNRLQKRFTFGHMIIVLTWLWALTWPLFAIAPNPVALAAVNAIGFTVVTMHMVVHFSYRLAVIPDQLQGRVQSVFKLLAFGPQPLALALTGLLLQSVGAVVAVWILFVPQTVIAFLTMLNRDVRHAGFLTELKAA